MIYPALLLSVCVLFSQCRAKSDVSSAQNVAGAVDVAAVDTVAAEKDTLVVVASAPEEQTTAAPAQVEPAVNPVPQGEPYPGFVYLRSLIPDLIEELRYFTTNNFMGVKVDGYEANLAILSKEAAKALASAADELREKGYVIKIFDAYRPQKAVDHFVRWSKTDDQRNKADYYPSLERSGHGRTFRLFRTALTPHFHWEVSRRRGHRGAQAAPHDAAGGDGAPRIQSLRLGVVAFHLEKRTLSEDLFRVCREVGGRSFSVSPKRVLFRQFFYRLLFSYFLLSNDDLYDYLALFCNNFNR